MIRLGTLTALGDGSIVPQVRKGLPRCSHFGMDLNIIKGVWRMSCRRKWVIIVTSDKRFAYWVGIVIRKKAANIVVMKSLDEKTIRRINRRGYPVVVDWNRQKDMPDGLDAFVSARALKTSIVVGTKRLVRNHWFFKSCLDKKPTFCLLKDLPQQINFD